MSYTAVLITFRLSLHTIIIGQMLSIDTETLSKTLSALALLVENQEEHPACKN